MADPTPRPCDIPDEFTRFTHPLSKFTKAFAGMGPIKIVAIGSSSTEGVGGIVPYPYRLEMALRERFKNHDPKWMIDVLNRGKGGEEAPLQLKRFDTDVLAEHPSLVIWQVGANAIFHNDQFDVDDVAAKIATGLSQLGDLPMDVVLMDMQYAPALVGADKIKLAERMGSLISAAADKAGVNLFRRFDLMRHWRVDDNIAFEDMIWNGDGLNLHQNDWSTRCVSQALDSAIAGAMTGIA
jgi:GDSL-like lipase/acylhydrolase family protein